MRTALPGNGVAAAGNGANIDVARPAALPAKPGGQTMKGRMSYTTAGVLLTGLLTCTAVPAESFDRGQALYENHCQTCHESHVHLRETRRASSLDELHKWVATWSWHANLGWSDEDITDVADYLNRHFYNFAVPGQD